MSSGFLGLLDGRSFSSFWFWAILVIGWSLQGRHILGVPADVLARARHALAAARKADGGALPDDDLRPAVTLLDWLSLMLPRWRLPHRTGPVLVGVAAFVVSTLSVLGFGFDLELAQALVLLALPWLILLALRLRLAVRLRAVLEAAHQGQSVNEAASEALMLIRRHGIMATGLGWISVAFTALWATRWLLLHPNGL